MANSGLISYTRRSGNHSPRKEKICYITPHCVVGQLSVESIANCFPTAKYKDGKLISGRQASCNYGIGFDGKIGLIVDESKQAWTSSSTKNDQKAVTIECASDLRPPYKMNMSVYNALIDLCVDICKRNGKRKLLWIPTKDRALSYIPKDDEMLLTVHRWYAKKSCPGDWLYNRLGALAREVTAELDDGHVLYRVQIGAFSKKVNADKLYKKIRETGRDAYITKKNGMYKVQVGAFHNSENADRLAEELAGEGFMVYITTE